MTTVRRLTHAAWWIAAMLAFIAPAAADQAIRVAIQKTGTPAWEMDVIRRNGFDTKAGVTLKLTELANSEGGKIALLGGSADVIVSDWLWVARQRSLGARLRFAPFSATVGALLVPADSKAQTLRDLKGRKLSVAGGPLDINWLLFRGYAKQHGMDLPKYVEPIYGAPPLLHAKMIQGEMDATLTYWNFAADLEAHGFRAISTVAEIARSLGTVGTVAMLGYVFDESFAAANAKTLDGFLAATREAKATMETSDAEWDRLRPLLHARDDATFAALRSRFREGIPRRPIVDEEADARILYSVLAAEGGRDLVGPATTLDAGTWYKP